MSKKRVNGAAKGSTFERYVAKQLSLWISNNLHDDLLWRTASSGGRETTRQKKGLSTSGQSGDLSTTSSESKFITDNIYFELKNYNDINTWTLLISDNTLINNWWTNLLDKSKTYKKYPLLIIKQKYKDEIIIVDEKFSKLLYKTFKIKHLSQVHSNSNKLYLYKFSTLLSLDISKFKLMLVDNKLNIDELN